MCWMVGEEVVAVALVVWGGLKRAAALPAARLAAPSTGLPEQLSTGAGK